MGVMLGKGWLWMPVGKAKMQRWRITGGERSFVLYAYTREDAFERFREIGPSDVKEFTIARDLDEPGKVLVDRWV